MSNLTLDQLRNKSATRLLQLEHRVGRAAQLLIEQSFASGVAIIITSGYRDPKAQDELYAQGRTRAGSIVTNARGGQSYHNYGLAFDFALLDGNGNPSWDTRRKIGAHTSETDWMEVVRIGKAQGLEWGGDWTSFKDLPHFQMSFGLSILQLVEGKRPPVELVSPPVKEEPQVDPWKLQLIQDAKAKGLITDDHNPDEPAPIWLVLAVALNALKVGEGK